MVRSTPPVGVQHHRRVAVDPDDLPDGTLVGGREHPARRAQRQDAECNERGAHGEHQAGGEQTVLDGARRAGQFVKPISRYCALANPKAPKFATVLRVAMMFGRW